MIDLVKADLYKETRKRSFNFTCILVILICIVYLVLSSKNINLSKNYSNLMPKLTSEEYKEIYKYGDYNKYEKDYEIYKNEVLLENQRIDLSTDTKAKSLIGSTTSLLYLLGILMIFKAFHSLSYDLQTKTIRYVFLSNHSRLSILLSKVLSLLIQMLFYIILTLTTVLITTYLLTNENVFALKEIIIYNSELIKIPYLLYLFLTIMIFMMPIVFMITFTFLLCLLFKGSSVTLIINMVLYLLGITISNLALTYNFGFVCYTFLPYLDYTYFIDNVNVLLQNAIYNSNFSYTNGLIILSLYTVISLIISTLLIKRDA